MSTETSQPHVFVVTDVPFWLEHRGSSRRIQSMIDYLGSFCRITICFTGELKIREWSLGSQHLESLGLDRKSSCSLIGPGSPGKLAETVGGQLVKVFPVGRTNDGSVSEETRMPVELGHFESKLISNFVCDQLNRSKPDLVLLEYVSMSYLCDAISNLGNPPTTVIDMHDLMYVRTRELAKHGIENWLRITEAEEIAALGKSNFVLAIQEEEAGLLKRQIDAKKVLVAKHPANVMRVPAEASAQKSKDDFVIGFLGSRGKANRISLEQFLIHCWPQILAACPTAMLKVGGRISSEDIASSLAGNKNLSRVEFVGAFDDLADFYSQLDIAINPALIASGFKIKSVEALSYSLPLVATQAGMAGLAGANECCALVSKDWPEFAANVVRLAKDRSLVHKFVNQCKGYIESHFAPAVVFEQLKKIIEESARHAGGRIA